MTDTNGPFTAMQREAMRLLQTTILVVILIEVTRPSAVVWVDPIILLVAYTVMSASGLLFLFLIVQPRQVLERARGVF